MDDVPRGTTNSERTSPAWHALSSAATAQALRTDFENGLSTEEVSRRVEEHGRNVLAQAPTVPRWKKLLGQFKDLVIWILIVAAIISGAMGEWTDTVTILAIVVVNGIIGFLQEEKAGRALSALQEMSSPMARAIRDGAMHSVLARDLVPGDRVELEAGDSIPADVRLLESFSFRVQEAALTGESVPVDKSPADVLDKSTPLGDRRNMAYLGTMVTSGKAGAVVVATGMNTELGRIAGMLQRAEPEITPLQKRLAELGKVMIIGCLVIVCVIFGLQVLRGEPLLETLLIAVSLAVAAVPEGLPAVVTLTLALGLHRMVKRNALVRKLPSVESLGAVTVICTDKTGTLTRNEMTVREVVAGGDRYEIEGGGYSPHGRFLKFTGASPAVSSPAVQPLEADGATGFRPVDPREEVDIQHALTAAARCNGSVVTRSDSDAGKWNVIGDPTEGALVVAAMKAGIPPNTHDHHPLHEIPFDSERKAMSVVIRGPNGTAIMYSKGAPEVILDKCHAERRGGQISPLSRQRRNEILQAGSGMAARALRVLALASREDLNRDSGEYVESDLIFGGLVGMIDPPREEVKAAIHKCLEAGIRTIMITGDHPATALAIARELKIADAADQVVTGQALDALSDDELAAKVDQIAVYARVSAEHKLRVVRALKRRGQIVAMTGDGVNDAPAVQAADIGIAMGITGTDVTKAASDMVLMDDNFASIVSAVEEGRGIFDNIQKVMHYLLSCNIGEVLLMFFASVVGWPVPLIAIQILWINLVTDGLPALALGMERPERDIMRRKPRPPQAPMITWRQGALMLFHGSMVATVGVLGFWITRGGDDSRLPQARTVAFCITAYSQLFLAVSCRSQRRTLPELGPFTNLHLCGAIAISGLMQLGAVSLPLAKRVFDTDPPGVNAWLLIVALALVPVTVIEIVKLLKAALRKLAGSAA